MIMTIKHDWAQCGTLHCSNKQLHASHGLHQQVLPLLSHQLDDLAFKNPET
jgi:hypothetical protein